MSGFSDSRLGRRDLIERWKPLGDPRRLPRTINLTRPLLLGPQTREAVAEACQALSDP